MRDELPALRLEQFEGPFDLLIELVRQRKLDLSTISLREITDSFIEYVRAENIRAEVVGDFVVVASTLLLLKVKQLLPRTLTAEEEEEVIELTDRVRIYELYRQQAERFVAEWQRHPLLPARYFGQRRSAIVQHVGIRPGSLTMQTLTAAFRGALHHLPPPPRPTAHLRRRGRNLADCMALFTERLARQTRFVFQHATRGEHRQDTAVFFLAALELAKRHHITLEQEDLFAELHLVPTSQQQ